MVTVLDSDSDDDNIAPQVISNRLLSAFLRPQGGKRISLSAAQLKQSNDSTSSDSRPQSKCSNVSVVITLPRQPHSQQLQPPSAPSGTISRKRSLSSSGDINVLSRKLAATEIPDHHGLSQFFSIESSDVKGPQLKLKRCHRSAVRIPQQQQRYTPPKRRNDKESATDRLEALYNKKLRCIKGPPVRFVAAREMARDLNFNFDFIDRYKLHDGVEEIDTEYLCGCNCVKCDANCECLAHEDIIHYQRGRAIRAVLTPDIIKKRTAMIKECSPRCSCSSSGCWNHLVYRGRRVKLEIFQTGNCGFGVRSPHSIERGQFIDVYVGEVIDLSTSDNREEAIDAEIHSSYLFSLDYFAEETEVTYVVDGRKFGSITRFMNHSCNPTCRMIPVSQSDDPNVYQLAFFAIQDIPAGTELTFDYHPGWEKQETIDSGATRCLCGEPNCRGQLWPSKRKTTRPGEDTASSSDDDDESSGESGDDK
ncbi:histone-lysine N-methyltransferase [Nannizzia gypsea CBS 118893]|uniref:Histone-lysine N-methyltransferase n=1 Tax=Arthroderma gypseum (strain ATCC MYA-4604 / CBS 118893) TaxID=535722 RepID=E4UTH5_ARTGP|nr:histone-lysine N-methyltransferase [Nannizzia gypsea CBS 118893]EFR01520.1 histone-lysine N-methyltransferase [Nannizzia gypsea CBS 118893]